MIFVNNDDVMGKNIRLLRQCTGLSPAEFAVEVGLEESTLSAIENGSCMEIDAEALCSICRLFHTDTQTLVEKNLTVMSLRGGL